MAGGLWYYYRCSEKQLRSPDGEEHLEAAGMSPKTTPSTYHVLFVVPYKVAS